MNVNSARQMRTNPSGYGTQPPTICNNYNIWMSSSRMGEGWVVRWAAPSLCNLNLTACCALPWTICCGCSLMHLRKGGPEEVT